MPCADYTKFSVWFLDRIYRIDRILRPTPDAKNKVSEERTRGGECRTERHAAERFGGCAAEHAARRETGDASLRLRRDGVVILCRVEV